MNLRFTERFEQKVDPKGRTTLPASFRKALGKKEKLYLLQEQNPYFLTLLPEQQIQKHWSNMPSPLNKSYSIEDTIALLEKIGSAREIENDHYGRINLRHQTIDNKTYFIGAGEYIIVYLGGKDRYEEYLKEKL